MNRRGPRDDTDGGEPFHEGDLDAKVCPTCWRALPQWHSDCPVCREPAVLRFAFAGAALPAVPDHLRDTIDEPSDTGDGPGRPAEDGQPAEVAGTAAAEGEAAAVGAHKPDDDPFQDPSPAQAQGPPAPMITPLGAGGGPGGLGGGGGCGGSGGAC